MKLSEWKKEHDAKYPNRELRAITFNELQGITEFDEEIKQPCKHELRYGSFEHRDPNYRLAQEDLKDLKRFANALINGVEKTYWELSNVDREMIDGQWKDKENLCSSDCLKGKIAFT
jgi:hypothetical protein